MRVNVKSIFRNFELDLSHVFKQNVDGVNQISFFNISYSADQTLYFSFFDRIYTNK